MGIKNDSCTCAMGTRNMGFQGSVTIDEMKNEAYIREKKDLSIVLPNNRQPKDGKNK